MADQGIWGGLLRHGLQLMGGALIARGTIDPAGWELVTGAVLSLGTLGAYLWTRRAAR